jgi:flavodoxin
MQINKYLVVFASKGRSAKTVAQRTAHYLNLDNNQTIDVTHNVHLLTSKQFQHLICVSPTYGDEELEEGMENFLIANDWTPYCGHSFSVIELGLYRGYDSPLLGAAKIIQTYLSNNGLIHTTGTLSLDSVPTPNEALLDQWLTKSFAS